MKQGGQTLVERSAATGALGRPIQVETVYNPVRHRIGPAAVSSDPAVAVIVTQWPLEVLLSRPRLCIELSHRPSGLDCALPNPFAVRIPLLRCTSVISLCPASCPLLMFLRPAPRPQCRLPLPPSRAPAPCPPPTT